MSVILNTECFVLIIVRKGHLKTPGPAALTVSWKMAVDHLKVNEMINPVAATIPILLPWSK